MMRKTRWRPMARTSMFLILVASIFGYLLPLDASSTMGNAQSQTTVFVYSNVCGFEVWWDGKHIFTTPSDKDWCWFYCVYPGKHTITLKKSGCADATVVVNVIAGIQNEFTINMNCGGGGGSLNLDIWTDKGCGSTYEDGDRLTIYYKANRDCYAVLSEIMPDGSTQILDQGWLRGGTTYSDSGTLKGPGKRIFIISAENEEARCTVYVEEEEKTGSIEVYVKDDSGKKLSGASVYLDDDYQGKTNNSGYFLIEDVSEGYHTVEASKSGYGNDSKRVNVKAGKTETVNLILEEEEEKTGSIEVYVKDDSGKKLSGASVYLDDDYQGKTNNSGYFLIED